MKMVKRPAASDDVTLMRDSREAEMIADSAKREAVKSKAGAREIIEEAEKNNSK